MSKKFFIKNIGTLYQVRTSLHKLTGSEFGKVPALHNAWVSVEGGRIKAWGRMDEFSGFAVGRDMEVIDADGASVLPCFVDAHTHVVYTGSREAEFVMRLQGKSYEEIARAGGGILHSAEKLRKAEENQLFEESVERVKMMIKNGTGAIEIKSGYGLSLESELKMLRVIQRIKNHFPVPVKATFLGAHAVPGEFKNNKAGYIQHLIHEMIPAVGSEKTADYIDVFCENGYFTSEETIRILEAGMRYGLKPKVHAEQLSHSGGISAGVRCGAVSVDHLEYANDEDIALLKESETIPVLLPGAQWFLGLKNPPVREMISAGLPVAISSDFNPGSCPSGNMALMMAMACTMYKLTPEEAYNACTVNSAYAMDVQNYCGSVTKEAKAHFIFLKKGYSLTSLAYYFGMPVIDKVFIADRFF